MQSLCEAAEHDEKATKLFAFNRAEVARRRGNMNETAELITTCTKFCDIALRQGMACRQTWVVVTSSKALGLRLVSNTEHDGFNGKTAKASMEESSSAMYSAARSTKNEQAKHTKGARGRGIVSTQRQFKEEREKEQEFNEQEKSSKKIGK